jgi:hypothetical protein
VLGADVGSMEHRQISIEEICRPWAPYAHPAALYTIMLAEKLHNTLPRRGHTLAEFDSTNAVAQLTSRGQLLHLSLTSAAGSQSRQLVATFTWVVVRSVYNCLIYE